MDFFKALDRRRRDEKFYFRFSKHSTAVWGALLALVALLTQQVESVLNAAFALSGLTSGAMLGGLTLALWWRKGSPVPMIAGMLVSLGAMIVIYGKWRQEIAWPWYTLIGSLITVAVAGSVRKLRGSYAGSTGVA
jgi:Na+/proline symporter